LAVPTDTIDRVSKSLLEHGRVRRGYLGVGVQPAKLSKAQGTSGQPTGLLVASVETGSPAEKGGILLGDVLLSLSGHSLRTMEDLLTALSGDVVGQSAPIELIRGGKTSSLQVTIGERPAPMEEEQE
jgi:S1-C subfamily serine protease